MKKNEADCGCLGRVKAQKVDGTSISVSVILLLVTGVHFWLIIHITTIYWLWRAIGVFLVGGMLCILLGRIIVIKHLKPPTVATALPGSDLGRLKVGDRAPLFVARDQNGSTVWLEDFRGQKLLLTFISPGCSACPKALRSIKQVFQGKEPGVACLIISSADYEHNHVYAAEQSVDFPLLTVDTNLFKERYGVESIPFVYMLDEAGLVQAKGIVNLAEHLQALLRSAFPDN